MSYFNYDGSLAAETPSAVNSQWGNTTGNETLTGTSGADALSACGPNEVLIGNGGGDTFAIQSSGTQIQEVAGNGTPNQINAWQSTDLANYSNIENLNVGGSNDYAAGNSQDNVIYATGSHQQLYGGGGQDVLVGNGQSDTFIIVKGEGNDAIYGFNPASDVVRLEAGYSTFAQVQQHMSQVGNDVNIDLGDGSAMVLRNTNLSQLTSANFQLQLDKSQVGAMTFGDEFNNLSLWNGSSGTWATTFWYQDTQGDGGSIGTNGESEWYINSNYAPTASVQPWAVSSGVLSITAAPASAAVQPLINGYQYTSGEINTAHSFAQTYGYFETRAELPQNAGGWPAFWLVPADGSWPPELDVMETLTNDPHADYTTSHSSIGGNTQSQGVAFIPDTSSGYHTYGVLWTKTTLTWYVDGTEVYQTATPADMNKPMYMIANLALGGWGGSVDASQLPAQLKIDYIHAYALADGSSTVSLDTAPADTSGAGPDTGMAASSDVATTTPGATVDAGSTTTVATTPPATGSSDHVFTSPGPGSVETGTTGSDTFYASQGGDTLTGHGGGDLFVFKTQPWAPDHITDFHVGTDKLDLSALFQAAGYTGSDPVADHYITLESDGNGGTLVRFDASGQANIDGHWPNTIIDLEGVSPTGLSWSQLTGSTSGTDGTGVGATGSTGATTPPATTPPVTTPPVSTGVAGLNLTSAAPGSVLTGGDGADTLHASQGLDTLTGGAGNDDFVLTSNPWAPIHVTDFQLGADKLDLSALFQQAGYTGSDPIADHYIVLEGDGNGGTLVRFDAGGQANIDGHWPNTIVDLEHVSPTGLTWSQLQGPPPGEVLTSTAPGTVLVGGDGPDTLYASQGLDTLTGGQGADDFVLTTNPWAPIHITDFQVGTDKLDLTALFKAAGYTGSDPVADHYVTLESDGNGGTLVRFDAGGRANIDGHWPNTIVDLEHVSPTNLTWSQLQSGWIVH